MNIFVTFFLLLLVLAGQTPNAVKEFPLIGAYFCLNMIMITLSTFLATLVIHFHYRGARNGPLPPILHRVIVEGMGRLMLVRQSIPLPEEKKTLSHVVTRTAPHGLSGFFGGGSSGAGGAGGSGIGYRGSRRCKVRVPQLTSNKFFEDDDFALEEEDHFNSTNSNGNHYGNNNESPRRGAYVQMANCVKGAGGWRNHIAPGVNRMGYPGGGGGPNTCPGCTMGPGDSIGDLSRRSGGDWHGAAEALRSAPAALNPTSAPPPPNADSGDSPIMLSSCTSLERDVRELKRYVRMFVNRQKEGAKKNAIAMEWRTMALVLDRLFFFVYIATIGITVVTSLPRKKGLEM